MRPVQLPQHFRNHFARPFIQIPGRLIGEQIFWLPHKRPRQHHSLLFAAGEFSAPVVRPCSQPNFI